MIPDRRPLTDALITHLAAATAHLVGDHEAPPTLVGDDNPVTPYAVVYALDGGEWYGPTFGAAESMCSAPYQVTSVGESRDQAEWLADKVSRALCQRSATGALVTPLVLPNGLTFTGIEKRTSAQPTPEGKLWSQPEQYLITFSVTT